MTADPRREADALATTAGVRILDDTAVLEIAGDDARTWLNGQVTNDVRSTRAGDAVYALAVSVKGRVMSDAWILDRGDGTFHMLVPSSAVARLLESFDAQIIMEDVEPRVREELAVVTVQGPRAADVVARVGASGDASSPGSLGWPCDRLGKGGLDLVVDRAAAGPLVETIAEAAEAVGGVRVSDAGWELARLRGAVPRFGRDFDERSYPQEAGLKDRAVSFEKGCYLGQEVVCMLENRGQLKQKLVALSLPKDASTSVGALLVAEGKEVGHITSLAPDPASDVVRALGYVKRAFAAPNTALDAAGATAEIVSVVS